VELQRQLATVNMRGGNVLPVANPDRYPTGTEQLSLTVASPEVLVNVLAATLRPSARQAHGLLSRSR
jgi:hypothetical protein